LPLLTKTTCPHCWANFDPADVLWVSVHQDLKEDPRLGPEEQLRFLPSLFTADGEAIDLRGMVCRELACPSCHLPIPRAVLELEPHFVSVMGTPSCGKSYYLAALSWQLRQLMPSYFALSFADADPTVNIALTLHEQQLFLNPTARGPDPEDGDDGRPVSHGLRRRSHDAVPEAVPVHAPAEGQPPERRPRRRAGSPAGAVRQLG
jgi:hypothetical protein